MKALKERQKKKYKLLKKQVKQIKYIHRPQKWGNHEASYVCDNCKIPYPCSTIKVFTEGVHH